MIRFLSINPIALLLSDDVEAIEVSKKEFFFDCLDPQANVPTLFDVLQLNIQPIIMRQFRYDESVHPMYREFYILQDMSACKDPNVEVTTFIRKEVLKRLGMEYSPEKFLLARTALRSFRASSSDLPILEKQVQYVNDPPLI